MDAGTVSSWVAACISVLSLGASLWVRYREHTEADLVTASNSMLLSDRAAAVVASYVLQDVLPKPISVAIVNDGDGVAHRLALSGEDIKEAVFVVPDPTGGRGSALPWTVFPRLAPGELVHVLVWPKDSVVIRDDVRLHVRWRRTPTWLKRDAETSFRIHERPPSGKLPGVPSRWLRGVMQRIG